MLKTYAVLTAYIVSLQLILRERVDAAQRDERGLSTLEIVVIGLGLLTFATAAVAVFWTAIDTRLKNIK